MSELANEQLSLKERAEQLQVEFGKFVDESHLVAGQAFGETGNRFLASGRHSGEAESRLASKFITGFDKLYRSVPEGHHLDLGISPLKWAELQRKESLRQFTRKEITPIGPQYWLKVARYVENHGKMDSDRTSLNLSAIGTNDPDNPSAKLEPVFVSKDGIVGTAKSIYPEDVLSIKVITNPQKT